MYVNISRNVKKSSTLTFPSMLKLDYYIYVCMYAFTIFINSQKKKEKKIILYIHKKFYLYKQKIIIMMIIEIFAIDN